MADSGLAKGNIQINANTPKFPYAGKTYIVYEESCLFANIRNGRLVEILE